MLHITSHVLVTVIGAVCGFVFSGWTESILMKHLEKTKAAVTNLVIWWTVIAIIAIILASL